MYPIKARKARYTLDSWWWWKSICSTLSFSLLMLCSQRLLTIDLWPQRCCEQNKHHHQRLACNTKWGIIQSFIWGKQEPPGGALKNLCILWKITSFWQRISERRRSWSSNKLDSSSTFFCIRPRPLAVSLFSTAISFLFFVNSSSNVNTFLGELRERERKAKEKARLLKREENWGNQQLFYRHCVDGKTPNSSETRVLLLIV